MLVAVPGGRREPESELEGWARAAQHGDRAATRQLVAALLPRVRNLVRYLIRGDRDVDDIAQEALIDIVRGLPGYRAEGKVTSWADRIAARATFAWLRKHRSGEASLDERRELADPAPGPESYTARRDVVRWLDELPFEQRHALVLHHVAGFSVPEIADEMRAPVETIRSRLRLGMKRLRALAGDEEELDAAAG